MNTEELDNLTNEEFEDYLKRRNEKIAEERKKKRSEYEELKINTIAGLGMKAANLNNKLRDFKQEAFDEMQTLYKCLQEYSSRHADGKGNFTVDNDKYKVSYKKQGKCSFDERAFQAEKHIKEFLDTRYSADNDTKDLIMQLLERKNGDLDVNLVQKLYQMEDRFQDENWIRGIQLLKESYQYTHSKDYIKFEEKNDQGEWIPISLQFSKI